MARTCNCGAYGQIPTACGAVWMGERSDGAVRGPLPDRPNGNRGPRWRSSVSGTERRDAGSRGISAGQGVGSFASNELARLRARGFPVLQGDGAVDDGGGNAVRLLDQPARAAGQIMLDPWAGAAGPRPRRR